MANHAKLEATLEIYANLRDQILNDREKWNEYVLKYASQFYKYNLTDQILIFAQKPEATICAEYELWKKQGKYVKRGTKGIALIITKPDGRRGLRYVFDVSDTGGKREITPWSYRVGYEKRVAESLSKDYQCDSENITDKVKIAAEKLTKNYLSKNDDNAISETLTRIIYVNSTVSILERMGIRAKGIMPEYDDNITNIKSENEKDLLLNGIRTVSEQILRTVERAVWTEIKERKAKNDKANDRERNSVSLGREMGSLASGSQSGRGETGDDRTLRDGASEISESIPSGGSEQNDFGQDIERGTGETEQESSEESRRTGSTASEERSGSGQSGTSDGMGGAYEHAEGTGDRNSNGRDGLHLNGVGRNSSPPAFSAVERTKQKSAAVQASLFSFEEEDPAATEKLIDEFLEIDEPSGAANNNSSLRVSKDEFDNALLKWQDEADKANITQEENNELIEEVAEETVIDTNFTGTAPMQEQKPKEEEPDDKQYIIFNAAPPINYKINDPNIGVGTPKERYANNVAAIRLLKKIESENRRADESEQEILAKYVGWGGLANAFDAQKNAWAKEYAELKELLSEEEYNSARDSTLTAFYTPPIITDAIYKILEKIGFKGGNVLEPAMGTGNFFGTMPEEMENNSRLFGVEIDGISGRIAAQLYQNANISVCGYQNTHFHDNFFDVAISNVPYGQFKVPDKRYNKLNYSIHDYYFAKTLDKVRPGGIIAFVTSRYTMDKANLSARKYIAQRAELLGAIRLPDTAFKNAAGTEVVSDILILQKRERFIETMPEWVYTGKTTNGAVINEYFIEHPEMVCGTIELTSSAYGPIPTCKPTIDKDLTELLDNAIDYIDGEITRPSLFILNENEENANEKTIPADPTVRNYSYTIVDGEIYYRQNAIMYKDKTAKGKKAKRINGLIALRDCTRELIAYQLDESYSDTDIKSKQRELRNLYDDYTQKYGLINNQGNKSAFKNDSSYNLLCSLEVIEKVDNKIKLKKLADIFSKRTISVKTAPDKVDTAIDALCVSIAEKAAVDINYISSLYGKTEEETIKELEGIGAIYKDPKIESIEGTAVYVTADEYLSGDILKKIQIAKYAEQRSPGKYTKNISALEEAMPKKLTASEITVRLGTPWIDEKYIKEFIFELLDTPLYIQQRITVAYIPTVGEWKIDGKNADYSGNVKAYQTYGTDKINAYKLIELSLNNKTANVNKTITTPDGKKVSRMDVKATTLVQQKQELIKERFKEWIFKDIERRDYLVDKYNRKFNNIKPREYNGDYLNLSGISPEVELKKHQKDAVARIIYGPNTLLAHVVGAGKTFEMVAAAMESKRLGLCNKAMLAVPKHLTEQTANEFLRLYPAANILVAEDSDFEKNRRKIICSRIATGDYDAIIIGHTQLEKIPISEERHIKFIQEQIDEITEGIRFLEEIKGAHFSVKDYVNTKRKLERKMAIEKKKMDARKDDVITFEELGIDMLLIDEAHNFKNLETVTKMNNVTGISTRGSQKSTDLLMKCRYMDEITGGKGVVFATGTPLSNSMVEMYTMQRYLQANLLNELGLSHFDEWAGSFGETANVLELRPESNSYGIRTRFAKFFNLPELMTMLKECADIKTQDMLNLEIPTAHFENVVVQPSEIQLSLIKKLSKRAENVRNHTVSIREDNMLTITNDGRKIGLDPRLIDDTYPDFPSSKVNICVEKVFDIWEKTAEQKSTQIIFCDISTPNPKKFNLYDDIKKKLIEEGIPEEEIAFIHDTGSNEKKKEELFEKVRNGTVRILMGSTQKMGAGTNVQERLIASHDLDCPWRPADLEQRAGRIIRQGNKNTDVYVFRYVTERTFDAYLYQTIEAKQKFISQIMTSRSPLRSCEDVDESVLQYSEIKALCAGDSRIKEKMDLDIQVSRLTMLRATYNENKYKAEQQVIRTLPLQISETKKRIAELEEDILQVTANTHIDNKEKFSPMTIRGKVYTKKDIAGEAILAEKKLINTEPVRIGEYRGMEIYIGRNFQRKVSVVEFRRPRGEIKHEIDLSDSAHGNLVRINNELDKIPNKLEKAKLLLEQSERNLTQLTEEMKRPFEYEEELREKQERLNILNIELSDPGLKDLDIEEITVEEEEDLDKELDEKLDKENTEERYSLGTADGNKNTLPPISFGDIKTRIKGADITDEGNGKLTINFVNGTKWIVNMQANAISAKPEIVARDYGRELTKEDVVAGRTTILNGGTFIDLVSGMSTPKTFSHEIFEAVWGTLSEDEQKIILSDCQTREAAADRYADFLEGRISDSQSSTAAIFRKIKDFFNNIRESLFGRNSEDIFRQIAEGKVQQRNIQEQNNDERYDWNFIFFRNHLKK